MKAVTISKYGDQSVLTYGDVERPKPKSDEILVRNRAVASRSATAPIRRELTIDSPLAIADLCSKMRFLDRESLRVVPLDAKQHLIKIATISQGTVNEGNTRPIRPTSERSRTLRKGFCLVLVCRRRDAAG